MGAGVNQQTDGWTTGILHWKTNNGVTRKFLQTQKKITISAGNNCKASNNVPIFVFF